MANYFDVDSRGIGFSSFFLPPAKLGGGTFYLGANFDSSGQPLRGENTYRLRVPVNVPVSQFWALTIYNSETSALFLNLTRPTLDSLDKGVRKNSDGSVDLYLGPKAPAGQESNWIHTPPGEELVRLVSFLRAGEVTLRQELEDAGHREGAVNTENQLATGTADGAPGRR